MVTGQFYHIYSRSIAGFIVFNNPDEYSRMIDIFSLYQYRDFNHKYSRFADLDFTLQAEIRTDLEKSSSKYVDIVAYCLMPTHLHLILKQSEDGGISTFISKTLNSYTRYFNIRHKRIGPLWEGRFKNVFVENDEQMIHLTRYIHLNPSSASIVNYPIEWPHSSYGEYIELDSVLNPICLYREILDIVPSEYKRFVNDYKDFQRNISEIKKHLIDNYTG